MSAKDLLALLRSDQLPADALDRAAAGLDDADPKARVAAIVLIGRLATLGTPIEETLALRLLSETDDGDPDVRAEAAAALAMLSVAPAGAAEAIRNLLDDPNPHVRQEACAALGDLKDEAARDRLAETLADADAEVRFEAAFALGSLRDRRARDVLESALAVTRKRLDACEGLRRLGDPAAIAALEKLGAKLFLPWVDRLTVAATLFVLGRGEAGALVLERTRARGRDERAYALSLIGSHRIGEGRALLEEVARDAKDSLRDTAVRALGELGDRAALETLRLVAGDPDPLLAADARAAISRIEDGDQ